MLTTAIGARLATCAAILAVAGGFALSHPAVQDTAPTGNLAAARTIHDATLAGSQVAYREVGGRIVIDAIDNADVRTAALSASSAVN